MPKPSFAGNAKPEKMQMVLLVAEVYYINIYC